jgi:hypothetical protein
LRVNISENTEPNKKKVEELTNFLCSLQIRKNPTSDIGTLLGIQGTHGPMATHGYKGQKAKNGVIKPKLHLNIWLSISFEHTYNMFTQLVGLMKD